jgi:hypothetical protein
MNLLRVFPESDDAGKAYDFSDVSPVWVNTLRIMKVSRPAIGNDFMVY